MRRHMIELPGEVSLQPVGLGVHDMQSRQGMLQFRVKGKRGKIRFVPVHAMAQRLLEEYLAQTRLLGELSLLSPLFSCRFYFSPTLRSTARKCCPPGRCQSFP
jgi:integrase